MLEILESLLASTLDYAPALIFAALGGMFSERKLEVKDVHVHPLGDAAWAEFDWDFTAKLKTDGSTVKTQGRETQIYRKEPAGWRLVHVHYSGMPVSAPGQ